MNSLRAIKRALLQFYPERYFNEIYGVNEEILNDLSYIRQIPFHKEILKKLLNVFLSIDAGKLKASSHIKQKLLRTIKAHVKQSYDKKMEKETKDDIFAIFKRYVFKITYSDLANSILINMTLDKDQISWLLDNHAKNMHILNRILRYPKYDSGLAEWAIEQYKKQKYFYRQAELIGLFLQIPIQSIIKTNDLKVLYWGIYYSRLPKKDKKNLLNEYYCINYLDHWIDVVTRLKYPELLVNKL